MSFAHPASPDQRTVKQQLGDALLGGDGSLERFVRERRPGMSWRRIAQALDEAVGLDVTIESLRRWYPDDEHRVAS